MQAFSNTSVQAGRALVSSTTQRYSACCQRGLKKPENIHIKGEECDCGDRLLIFELNSQTNPLRQCSFRRFTVPFAPPPVPQVQTWPVGDQLEWCCVAIWDTFFPSHLQNQDCVETSDYFRCTQSGELEDSEEMFVDFDQKGGTILKNFWLWLF